MPVVSVCSCRHFECTVLTFDAQRAEVALRWNDGRATAVEVTGAGVEGVDCASAIVLVGDGDAESHKEWHRKGASSKRGRRDSENRTQPGGRALAGTSAAVPKTRLKLVAKKECVCESDVAEDQLRRPMRCGRTGARVVMARGFGSFTGIAPDHLRGLPGAYSPAQSAPSPHKVTFFKC